MSRKKTLLCLIWAFLLLLIPAVGASAATEVQYVYLTPSENGSQTGVIVALNGTEPESASLDYGTGTVKASEISGNHLVFSGSRKRRYGEKSEKPDHRKEL